MIDSLEGELERHGAQLRVRLRLCSGNWVVACVQARHSGSSRPLGRRYSGCASSCLGNFAITRRSSARFSIPSRRSGDTGSASARDRHLDYLAENPRRNPHAQPGRSHDLSHPDKPESMTVNTVSLAEVVVLLDGDAQYVRLAMFTVIYSDLNLQSRHKKTTSERCYPKPIALYNDEFPRCAAKLHRFFVCISTVGKLSDCLAPKEHLKRQRCTV
jgi:hypothetical protein